MALTATNTFNIGTGQTLNTPYPIHMLQAMRLDANTSTRIQMEIIADANYNLLPSSSSGVPLQITYQPKMNMGVIKVWPTPDTYSVSNVTILLTYLRPLEYFSASTDTADFPEEWVSPIIYGLAVRLAPEYGVPLEDRQLLLKEYNMYLENAENNAFEDASIFFQPKARE